MDIHLFKKELQRPLRAVASKSETLANKLMEDDLQECYLLSIAIKKELETEYFVKLHHLLKDNMINIINLLYEHPELTDEQGKRLENIEKRIHTLPFEKFNDVFVSVKKIKSELEERK